MKITMNELKIINESWINMHMNPVMVGEIFFIKFINFTNVNKLGARGK